MTTITPVLADRMGEFLPRIGLTLLLFALLLAGSALILGTITAAIIAVLTKRMWRFDVGLVCAALWGAVLFIKDVSRVVAKLSEGIAVWFVQQLG